MRPILIAFVLLAAACAPRPDPVEAPVNAAVPAPTPNDISIRIGADQAGQVVTVRRGERFAIELVGTPTAGYVWEPAALPSFLERAGESSGPTTQAQNQPGFAGGNHWEVLVLRATGTGMGDVRMEKRRPWESDEAPVETFTVTIQAR